MHDQVHEDVEHLGFEVDEVVVDPQVLPVDVEVAVLEAKPHPCLPRIVALTGGWTAHEEVPGHAR